MGDGSETRGAWGRYLRDIADRPGWSVARLAREANLNRTTIFDWIREGNAMAVTIGSILAIAKAAGDHPLIALRAASGVLDMDDDDPELEQILTSGLPEDQQREMIAEMGRRRAEDQARRLADIERTIRLILGPGSKT